MTKIALLTDTHCGVRGDSKVFLDHQGRFYENVFFPTCKKHGIDHVVHAGDMFDKRKHTNTGTLSRFRRHFLEPLMDMGKDFTVICGNHDAHLRQTNQINALRELLPVDTSRININIIDGSPKGVFIGGVQFGMIPWMTADNEEECLKFILKSKSPYIIGHFEMAGFPFYRGIMAEHGLDASIFKKFKRVFSGHYHTKTTNGNVTYLGTSMEFTWADYNDPKGFHIFDTVTEELLFIPNPDRMFYQYVYEDQPLVINDVLEDRCVKLIVKKKDDPKLLDKTLEQLREMNPHELSVVDRVVISYSDDIETESKTTLQIMDEFIETIDGADDTKKDKLKTLMTTLYNEVVE